MSLKTQIEDSASGFTAKVTALGQVVVGALAYDETVFKELAEDDTAYNFYKPQSGRQVVITGVLFRADKQVSSTVDATVVIYEASTDASTIVDKILIQFAVVQGDIITATGLNLLVNAGKFVNAKTTDDDIHMTIMGYFIDALGD